MKALTKGQYEGIAGVLAESVGVTKSGKGTVPAIMYGTLATLVLSFADQFQESDPEFKRELFLSQCGITKEDIK